MPRMIVLCQAIGTHPGKLLVKGVFTQTKKVWGAIELLTGASGQPSADCAPLGGMSIYDDVRDNDRPAKYDRLCAVLRRNGRAIFKDEVGDRSFLLIECELNQLRESDLDTDGKPRACPLAKEETKPAGGEPPPKEESPNDRSATDPEGTKAAD